MASKLTTKDEERKVEWHELSSFVVEFGVLMAGTQRDNHYRTIIHHIEGGETYTWPSIAAIEAAQWMENRLLQVLPVREEIFHKRGGELVEQIGIDLRIEKPEPESCSGGEARHERNNRFLGGVAADSSIQLMLEVVLPDFGSIENSIKEVPLGIFIHSQTKESVVTLISRNSVLKLPFKKKVGFKFEGITLPRGFHQIYGMAILYLEKPIFASTDAQVLRVY
ncbi:MAG: hypothetical protein ACWA44_11885 [Thiotrichales bacterium]